MRIGSGDVSLRSYRFFHQDTHVARSMGSFAASETSLFHLPKQPQSKKKTHQHNRRTICKVMKELQDKDAAKQRSAPRRKTPHACFLAIILLAAGTDFHHKDIASVVVRTLKQKIHLDLSSWRTEKSPSSYRVFVYLEMRLHRVFSAR